MRGEMLKYRASSTVSTVICLNSWPVPRRALFTLTGGHNENLFCLARLCHQGLGGACKIENRCNLAGAPFGEFPDTARKGNPQTQSRGDCATRNANVTDQPCRDDTRDVGRSASGKGRSARLPTTRGKQMKRIPLKQCETALQRHVARWLNSKGRNYGDGAKGAYDDLIYGGC